MNTFHESDTNSSQGFKCPKCIETFDSYDTLKNHIKNQHPKKCSLCNEEVKNMSVHMRTQHLDDPTVKKFKCAQCDYATHTEKNLSQHIFVRHRKNEHKFSCNQCDKKFPANFLLKQHQEITHNGQNKRHICEKCGKAFAYKNGIKEHKCRPGQNESGTEVQCDKCESVFKREMDYLQHHKGKYKEIFQLQ